MTGANRSERRESQHSPLVPVAKTYGAGEWAVVRSRLMAAGMTVFDQGHHHATVNWQWMNALGGIILSVPASEAEDAIALLRNVKEQAGPEPKRPWWRFRWRTIGLTLVWFVTGIVPPDSGWIILQPPRLSQPSKGGAKTSHEFH
ncbi:hypothetical protein ACQQ2Q_04985 [Agrobacterium sp. ES01]|uniref:hypothetical protein n=1 Tax=Agrobacterium sp. ES01 TaxID=3420714 RepID=UPI003D0C0EE7